MLGANLNGTNLTGTNLGGANLLGTNLDKAIVSDPEYMKGLEQGPSGPASLSQPR
jgi:uncharacterized protein YjbI with pentapeptide repeats